MVAVIDGLLANADKLGHTAWIVERAGDLDRAEVLYQCVRAAENNAIALIDVLNDYRATLRG